MSNTRDIAVIVFALAIMHLGLGALAVAVPLGLGAAGASPGGVGVVVAFYGLGYLVGIVAAPRLVASVGHLRAFAAAAGVAAALTLALFAEIDPTAWALLRLLAGVCAGAMLTAGESWIADATTPGRRGALVSAYAIATHAGLVLGPFLVAGAGVGGAGAFMLAAAAFMLCLAPLAIVKSAPAPTPLDEAAAPKVLWAAAPSALLGAFVAGAVNAAVLNMSALYAARFDVDAPASAAASFQAALLVGGLLALFAVGTASNRSDRRAPLMAAAAVAALASAVLALIPATAPPGVMMLLAATWGAGALSLYALSAAHAADRAPQGRVAPVLGAVLVTWTLGAILGPIVAGAVMETGAGPRGLFIYAGLVLALFALAVWRRRRAVAPAESDRAAPYAPMRPTTLAVIEIDPRAAAELTDPTLDAPGDGSALAVPGS